jgi:hypothetical protein
MKCLSKNVVKPNKCVISQSTVTVWVVESGSHYDIMEGIEIAAGITLMHKRLMILKI